MSILINCPLSHKLRAVQEVTPWLQRQLGLHLHAVAILSENILGLNYMVSWFLGEQNSPQVAEFGGRM